MADTTAALTGTTRTYELTDAPATTTRYSNGRRLTIIPDKLEASDRPDGRRGTYLVLEGRSVRRDGTLSGRRIQGFGYDRDWNDPPPEWLQQMIDSGEIGPIHHPPGC